MTFKTEILYFYFKAYKNPRVTFDAYENLTDVCVGAQFQRKLWMVRSFRWNSDCTKLSACATAADFTVITTARWSKQFVLSAERGTGPFC